MSDFQDVFIQDGANDKNGQKGARNESHILGQNGQDRRGEDVHILCGWTMGAVESRNQLVVDLVEVPQVQFGIAGPTTSPKWAWIPLDYVGIVEEGVKNTEDWKEKTKMSITKNWNVIDKLNRISNKSNWLMGQRKYINKFGL